jgi:hypothetical protein
VYHSSCVSDTEARNRWPKAWKRRRGPCAARVGKDPATKRNAGCVRHSHISDKRIRGMPQRGSRSPARAAASPSRRPATPSSARKSPSRRQNSAPPPSPTQPAVPTSSASSPKRKVSRRTSTTPSRKQRSASIFEQLRHRRLVGVALVLLGLLCSAAALMVSELGGPAAALERVQEIQLIEKVQRTFGIGGGFGVLRADSVLTKQQRSRSSWSSSRGATAKGTSERKPLSSPSVKVLELGAPRPGKAPPSPARKPAPKTTQVQPARKGFRRFAQEALVNLKNRALRRDASAR